MLEITLYSVEIIVIIYVIISDWKTSQYLASLEDL